MEKAALMADPLQLHAYDAFDNLLADDYEFPHTEEDGLRVEWDDQPFVDLFYHEAPFMPPAGVRPPKRKRIVRGSIYAVPGGAWCCPVSAKQVQEEPEAAFGQNPRKFSFRFVYGDCAPATATFVVTNASEAETVARETQRAADAARVSLAAAREQARTIRAGFDRQGRDVAHVEHVLREPWQAASRGLRDNFFGDKRSPEAFVRMVMQDPHVWEGRVREALRSMEHAAHRQRPGRAAPWNVEPERRGVVGRVSELFYVEDDRLADMLAWHVQGGLEVYVCETEQDATREAGRGGNVKTRAKRNYFSQRNTGAPTPPHVNHPQLTRHEKHEAQRIWDSNRAFLAIERVELVELYAHETLHQIRHNLFSKVVVFDETNDYHNAGDYRQIFDTKQPRLNVTFLCLHDRRRIRADGTQGGRDNVFERPSRLYFHQGPPVADSPDFRTLRDFRDRLHDQVQRIHTVRNDRETLDRHKRDSDDTIAGLERRLKEAEEAARRARDDLARRQDTTAVEEAIVSSSASFPPVIPVPLANDARTLVEAPASHVASSVEEQQRIKRRRLTAADYMASDTPPPPASGSSGGDFPRRREL